MKALVLAVKGIKESLRDIKSLAFLLIFPLMFLLLFRVAFGWSPEATDTYSIAVMDLDDGEGPWDQKDPEWLAFYNNASGTSLTAEEFFQRAVLQNQTTGGQFLVNVVFKDALYEDNETKMFDVKMVKSREKGEDLIKDGEVVALVIIPANFTSALQGIIDQAVVDEVRAHGVPINASSDQYAHTALDNIGSLTNYDFNFATSLVGGQVMGYIGALETIVRTNVGSGFPSGPVTNEGGSVRSQFVAITETEEFTVFDWQAPGIFIFALLMTSIYVSATLATEYKNKTIHRLRLTKMRSVDLMAGTTIRWMFVGALQVLILFFVAWGIGTRVAGDVLPTFAFCFVISMVVVLASISLGLIISAFIDDPEQAGNIGTAIAVPMSFLTEAFFPLDFAPAKVLPWTQGADAMKQLMLYNEWGAALEHMLYVLIGAFILFTIGVFIYQQRRLRAL
jgi:ABC-2 type transport system permease protein